MTSKQGTLHAKQPIEGDIRKFRITLIVLQLSGRVAVRKLREVQISRN